MLYTHFLGILLCVGSGFALYDSRSDVVDLTPSNFDKLVTDGNEVWLVEFYAPWCGHCKNLVPEYKKAAKALKGIVKVGAMDADQHKSFAHKFGVSGFPTIKIFAGNKQIPYKGQRTADALVDAALKATKEKVYERLGRKGSDYASDKSKPETFGHIIPWKQAIENTSAKSFTQKPNSLLSESADSETCKPQTNITQDIKQKKITKTVGQKQNTTKKIVGLPLVLKKNVQKRNFSKNTVPKKATPQNATEKATTTKIVTQKTTTMSVADRFRLLQTQLFRGQITDEDKPKIVNALMKLKSVLQGRGVVNATVIKRRSAQRQRKLK